MHCDNDPYFCHSEQFVCALQMVQGPCKATHLMQPAIPCSTRAQLQVIKRHMMPRAYGMTKTLSLAKFLKIRHHSSCVIDSQVSQLLFLQLLCLQLCLKYCHENVLENASVMVTRLAMLCMSSMLAADDNLTSNSVCVSLGLASSQHQVPHSEFRFLV